MTLSPFVLKKLHNIDSSESNFFSKHSLHYMIVSISVLYALYALYALASLSCGNNLYTGKSISLSLLKIYLVDGFKIKLLSFLIQDSKLTNRETDILL